MKQRALRTTLIAFCALLALGGAAWAEDAAQSLDAASVPLSDTNGNPVTLSNFKGKPTVVIYEDRGSTEQNRKLKDELWKRGHEAGLVDAANVVGVANLRSFDFWPARSFARSHVAKVEKKVGIPVLIDWKGTLQSSPWNLPSGSSTVMVFDSDGKLIFSHSGAMTETETSEVLGKLSTLVGAAKKPAQPHG